MATVGLSLALLTVVPPVSAYHQLVPPNANRTGYDFNAIGDCENSTISPCIRWRKNGSQSIVIQMYLSSQLDLGYIDLTTDVQNAVSAYNNIAALNPLIQYTNDTSLDEMTAQVYDANQYNISASTVFVPNPFTLTSNRITHATIRFNTEIFWRRQTGGFCDFSVNPPVCHADARKVANHEMGHAQGLGHEDPAEPDPAVMRQGFLTFFLVQPDDKNGIIHIYGAAP